MQIKMTDSMLTGKLSEAVGIARYVKRDFGGKLNEILKVSWKLGILKR